LTLLFGFFCFPLSAQGSQPPDVHRVLVSVFGDKSQQVRTDLPATAFEVEEGGKKCVIENVRFTEKPAAVAFVLDLSGSIVGPEPKRSTTVHFQMPSRQAVIKPFLDSGSAENDYLAIGFSQEVRLLAPFTRDREAILSSLDVSLGRRTSLYDAMALAAEHLKDHSNERKAIVVISDFEDNSSKMSLTGIRNTLREEGVLLFALVVPGDLGFGRAVAGDLVEEVGGSDAYPTAKWIPTAMRRFAETLRYCYAVEYRAVDGAPAGHRRQVKVKVRKQIAGEKCKVVTPIYSRDS